MSDELFPMKEYRVHEAKDLSIKATYAPAQSVIVNTQFDAATADTLAADYLAATSNASNFVYTFLIDGVLSLADLTTAIPRLSLSYSTMQDFVGRLVSMKTMDETGQTQVTIRGMAATTTAPSGGAGQLAKFGH